MRPRHLFSKFAAVLFVLFAIAFAAQAQVVKTIFSFDGNLQDKPVSVSFTQGLDGNLYGTTHLGLKDGDFGTVFRLQTNGTLQILHTFSGLDGAYPDGGLTLGRDGLLYGTTAVGGSFQGGTLFSISPTTGVLTVLHNFTGGEDGYSSVFPPIQGSDRNFYGLTQGAGSNYPTIYKYTPSGGVLSTVYTFNVVNVYPNGPLLQAADGTLWATTGGNGKHDCGSIVNVATSGVLLWTYHFSCSTGGNMPMAPVMQAADGNLYGTTFRGGTYNSGTIYKLDHSGTVTFLYNFGATSSDGAAPVSGLLQATDGNFYGATSGGGALAEWGTLFELTAGGTYSQLYTFPSVKSGVGGDPQGTLTQHTSGVIYGTTYAGGLFGYGSVYSLDMGLGPFVALVQQAGPVGTNVQVLGQGFTGTSSVTFSGIPAASFKVISDTYIGAVVPSGATTGPVVVTTPSGTLTSNKNFIVGP